MADIHWGDIVNERGKLGLNISVSNTSETVAKVTVEVWVATKASTSDSSNALYFNDGATSATTGRGSVTISHTSNTSWDSSNQTKIYTYTGNYKRATTRKKVNCAAKLTGVDWVGGTMTVTYSYYIDPLKSYTVSYNANDGSGAPSSQTKYYGVNLTLSSTKPTRTGYNFNNWKSPVRTATYAPGETYGYNQSTTMTAQWTAKTYTVSYDANGGSGAPSNQTKTYGVALTLSSTVPTRINYTFKGWGKSSTATTASYSAGASYTANSSITLYAIWELAYQKPTITLYNLNRHNGSTNDENGTYVVASFSWSCDQNAGSNPVESITLSYKKSTDSTYTVSKTLSVSGNQSSTPTSQIFGDGNISTLYSYDIKIEITDSKGGVTSVVRTVPVGKSVEEENAKSWTIDFLSGGKGVAMGKAAEIENAFECAFDIYANSLMYDRFGMKVTNGFAEYSSDTAIDPNETTEHLILTNHANAPMGSGIFYYILTVFAAGKSTSSYRAQLAIPYNNLASVYHRYYNGSWSDWRRHRNATNDCLTSLWSGSWASGTIIVPNTANYTMFIVKNSTQALYLPCFKYNNNVRGGSFFTNAAGGTQYMSDFAATISGETWTYVQATARNNTTTWANSVNTARTITNIYGVM